MGTSIVAGMDASPVLELAEHILDLVALKGVYCPRCGGFDRITTVKGGRAGLHRCGPCRREFTVTVGTIFERSKKGISAHQLHRTLQVTYKTAWFMEHRLREAMRDLNPALMGGEGKTVEADESFIGGKEKNKYRSKRLKQGRGAVGKEAVFSLVECGGYVRSHHVPEVTGKTLRPMLSAQLNRGTFLVTDEAGQYHHVKNDFPLHEVVRHGAGEYVRGDAHTNTIESYFAIIEARHKRRMPSRQSEAPEALPCGI